MADFMTPRITCHDPLALFLGQKRQTKRKWEDKGIRLTTLWCRQCLRFAVNEWDGGPLEVNCYIDDVSSKSCSLCNQEGRKCDSVPQGIRGHVFELMALLEFVKEYWTYCDDRYSQKRANGECICWPSELFLNLSNAVISLCTVFDDLAETHCEAHMLTGDVSDETKASYAAWCNAREHTIRPNTQSSDELHHRYAVRATENLRLRMGEEASIRWAAEIWAFYHAVRTAVKDYAKLDYDHIRYLEDEFPLEPHEL